MARQRSHSIAFKRQVAQEFIAGESLYAANIVPVTQPRAVAKIAKPTGSKP
jgi:hypothetical protein